jgi:hypothetical protein
MRGGEEGQRDGESYEKKREEEGEGAVSNLAILFSHVEHGGFFLSHLFQFIF